MRIGSHGLAVIALCSALAACADGRADPTPTSDASAPSTEPASATRVTTATSPTPDTAVPTTVDREVKRIERLARGSRPVSFRASDGVRIRGRLFGAGDVGVALAHMGRSGDDQEDWFATAAALADRGFLVLTYDRRGVCSPTFESCSDGTSAYDEHWRDVVGAHRFLHDSGARRVVVGGASIGAMASFRAVEIGGIDVAGVIWVAGIIDGDYVFEQQDVSRVAAPKLFISARDDVYGAAAAARTMHRWSSEPSELLIVDGSSHGTELLRPDAPPGTHREVDRAIVAFVERHLDR